VFERYNEAARRALFFARYEASQRGTPTIQPEHILLGVLRDGTGTVPAIFASAAVQPEHVRSDIDQRAAKAQAIPASVEIPFAPSTRRILQYAAEEADTLRHRHIGAEHLLLGILREEDPSAAFVLASRGITLAGARLVAAAAADREAEMPPATAENLLAQVDIARALVHQLAQAPAGSTENRDLAERLDRVLDALRRMLVR
jgi:ATP-dependent Clp protease ATP-binding subunit ClpC